MYGPLCFEPIFMNRVWGGANLADYYPELKGRRETRRSSLDGTCTPSGVGGGGLASSEFVPHPVADKGAVGEAWLLSDHQLAESVVTRGMYRGQTLGNLLSEHSGSILGRCAQVTRHGRFPLLLKVLGSGQPLSVQVHPDDECAERLGEPDSGKTEMWHVIDSDRGSEVICGLNPRMNLEGFRELAGHKDIEASLSRFEVTAGDSIFVPSGTVHAIGSGIVLAEIQQNSDLTYRIYDYDRIAADGSRRDLHIQKAAEAIHFGSTHTARNHVLSRPSGDGTARSVLAACRYFVAERLELGGEFAGDTRGDSFHILLCVSGRIEVETEHALRGLSRGEAALIPACQGCYTAHGTGALLLYYVPDLALDVVGPLRAAGYSDEAIVRLGGDPSTSDIAGVL